MHSIPSIITGGFWEFILQVNSRQAIIFQWEQLEKSGSLENFRICAGRSNHPRIGLFFSDSDAYKWLDAACRILKNDDSHELQSKVDTFTDLIIAAQEPDGYINTYNQILFPGIRWKNLQIEHELYCLGHLIEAGISHHRLTGDELFFSSIIKAADLICMDFWDTDWKKVDGHEEIEIALLKLAVETGSDNYREMAQRFLERRRAGRGYTFLFLKQAVSSVRRLNLAESRRKNEAIFVANSDEFILPSRNQHKTPWSVWPRLIGSLLSGKFAQSDEPLNASDTPVGHAVRFAYLETATAMLARQNADPSLVQGMEKKWKRMVSRRMYVTGGIGSLPLIEGFGRDYELDPRVAYNETCAALGSLFWNREMALLTGNPRYDDLFEWQLYNAASVGFGRDGCSYLYNNPLICDGHVHRAAWYDVPCCPSNISRTWASLGDYLYSVERNLVTIHQYISSEAMLDLDTPVLIRMESALPWHGEIRIKLEMNKKVDLELKLRYPSWAEGCELVMNGNKVEIAEGTENQGSLITACGVEIKDRKFIELKRAFADGDELFIKLDMPLKILQQDTRIHSCRGLAALSRGQIVYCLEDCDNPGLPLPPRISLDSLRVVDGGGDFIGIPLVEGKTIEDCPVLFIPYFLWGNRGKSRMSVLFYSQ
jgi:DUF1680 family protein